MKIWREKVYLWARLTLNQGIVWMSSRFRIRWSISLQNLVTIIIFVFNIIIIIKKMVITILTWEWSLWRARKWAPQAETQGFLSSSSPSSNCICMIKENCNCICVCICISLSFEFIIWDSSSPDTKFWFNLHLSEIRALGMVRERIPKKEIFPVVRLIDGWNARNKGFHKINLFPLIISSA